MTTKCYTFYSYKGGSGRSTTCMNTVRHLIDQMQADPLHPILLVDGDLESAGLTFFFHQEHKFSEDLNKIHTASMLQCTMNIEPLCKLNAVAGTEVPAPDAVTEALTALDVGISGPQLLDRVLLAKNEWNLLETIIIRQTAKDILQHYNFGALAGKLGAIHRSKSADDIDRKRTLIRNFLPATGFTDVSKFFGAPVGTVRFLGADIYSPSEKIAPNESSNAVRDLLIQCNRNHYAAVVFDSGAGTQSSAHVFHKRSDVLVYCMRPSSQFAGGTETNLAKYRNTLDEAKSDALKRGKLISERQKKVILLPAAVPRNTELVKLCDSSFARIRGISAINAELVDDYFCRPATALCEVELFKFREQVIGVPDPRLAEDKSERAAAIAAIVAPYEKMVPGQTPADGMAANETYLRLAQRLVLNSTEDEAVFQNLTRKFKEYEARSKEA